MNKTLFIIFGMMLVTYIPRVIPFYLVTGDKLNPKAKLFLEFVPYTALGALILPGAIESVSGHPIISLVGILFAGLISFFKKGMIITVIGSIGIVYLLLAIGV